ncbi:hypothetical protein WA026_002187 [Henosepilachna vigintioctopunctata]|uniref:Myb-like domain-containing protein n=1 Tax=Henosepilachna vigintioctopunctata TaxID=420089 RepID=A0AAW1TSU0_9CUCU
MYKMNHNNNETSKTIPYDSYQTDSNDSEWGLEIVIKSTPKKRRRKSIDPIDKKIIDEFEKDIEETLEEKAAKSNLSHTTVKSILKHVFTDEHVLALVKQKEGCEDVEGIIPYEPKITRSKAKELLSNTGSVISLPWQTRTATSEVQALLTQDLQEDSSGDEYVPGEEESEDDISLSVSNPPTPAPQGTPIRQCTDEVEAEIFKTPQQNPKKCRDQTENANIALRTRSKFCLNETPLEKIEQDFIPPDITTDMYEIYCNDEEWKEFLKSFTQPLEEVVKNTEDEDHDPEYNFLSDEEIETVDKEELRADKAVKVPRKELNDLMAELFEYVDIYSKKNDEKLACDTTSDSTNQFQQQLLDSCTENLNFSDSSNVTNDDNHPIEYCLRNSFTYSQLLLLQQQMRQHVQMLTQNFLLTYCHPIYADFSTTLKEYLLNFKFLSNENKSSVFNCTNLENSLDLVNSWEKLFENNDEAAMETRKQFAEVMEESVKRHSKREHYHLPFSQLIFKTIADSDIFMYPHLLPQIPFKHPDLLKKDIVPFSYSEYQLIALGLEQFIPYFMNVKEFMTNKKEINLKKIAELIHDLMMPARQPNQIYRQIYEKKHEKYLPNPIAYFAMHKKAPLSIQQVSPFISCETIPPRKRPPNLLPTQWRNYIWPGWRTKEDCEQPHFPKPTIMLNEPKKQKIPKTLIKLLPNLSSDLNPKCETKKESDSVSFKQKLSKSNDNALKIKFINCFRSTISYCEYYDLRRKIDCQNDSHATENIDDSNSKKLLGEKEILKVDNLPCLDISDTSNRNILCNDFEITKNMKNPKSICDTVETSVLNSSEITFSKWNKDVKNCKTYTHDKNELHSSTCETKAEREKQFLSRLATITPPELPTEKDKRVQFARTYFIKLKKTLQKADYIKVAYTFQKSYKKKFNAMNLYRILSPILKPKYQTLAEELLLFLDLELANAIGKLIPFLLTNHLDIFKTNIEAYFKHEPLLWRKIEESFLELDNKTFITLDRLKNTILPILRSHPLLCHNILEVFLKETTPSSLLNSTWEINDIQNLGNKENEKFSNSLAKAEKCDCFCHKPREQGSHHECTNCGLRFLDGRIYCQSSEGYKIINITFPFDPNIDDNIISSNEISHNSSRTLNSECGSNLEIFNEIKDIEECEIPNKVKSKFGKRTRKKQMLKGNIFKKNKMKPSNSNCISLSECINKTACCLKPTKDDLSCNDKLTVQCVELAPCSHDLSQKSPIKSLLEKNIENPQEWTREEDKVILQIFQQKIDEEAIVIIQKHLKNRSAEDIRTRFEMLMSLMQLMDY